MLVECATTCSSAGISNFISTTYTTASLGSASCTSTTSSCSLSTRSTNINCPSGPGSTSCSLNSTVNNGRCSSSDTNHSIPSTAVTASLAVNLPANVAADGLSSGSNSCSNSLGNSISTNSNSISNSNSIGNSWRQPKNAEDHCNGGGSESPWQLQSPLDVRGGTNYPASRSPAYSEGGPLHKACSDTTGRYIKYGSPLSESKIGKKSNGKAHCESKSVSNMVDVEACLANTPPHLLIRSLSSLSHHSTQLSTLPRPQEQESQGGSQTIQKGVLQQARDRLFSRWKERYFVLTRDYLACFRRGSTKYSEMGSFIFKVNLANVEGVWWEERRGGAVVAVRLPREGRVLLRARAHEAHLLQVWHQALVDATTASRLRRSALRRGTSSSTLHLAGPVGPPAPLHATLPHPSPSGNSSSDAGEDRYQTPKQASSGEPLNSLETDPLSTPPSSLTSLHKLSSNTSSGGSGCGSSVASSPGLGGGTGLAPSGWSPRSRFSLVESPRRLLPSAGAVGPPKTRHSLCLEPSDLPPSRLPPSRVSSATPLTPTSSRLGFPSGRRFTSSPAGQSRRSLCLDSLSASRTSLLSLTPRNPLLELLENSPPPSAALQSGTAVSQEREIPNPPALAQPRTRASLTLFRNSPLFN